jgi:hypothetical protein
VGNHQAAFYVALFEGSNFYSRLILRLAPWATDIPPLPGLT